MPLNDSDRPAVLAHQRFNADRESFADLDLWQRFQRIYDTNLWGAEKSISGLGSEMQSTGVLRAEVSLLLKRLGIASLLDAPCGDATWINKANIGVRYVGVDIVPALIKSLRVRAAAGEIAGEYQLADIASDPLPECDAVLCRDCLVHLSHVNIERVLANFRRSRATWLIATTFPEWQTNRDCEDGDWRALNLQSPPFNWGPPAVLLNEHCTEGGGGWRDKSLGAWKIATLPVV